MIHTLIHLLHKIWASTWRLQVHLPEATHIIGCWHEDIPIMLKVLSHRGYLAQVSTSGDGELLNHIFLQRGFKTVRGSSSRGYQSLRQVLKYLKQDGSVTMALDGPRGPRRQMQAGSPWLAQQSGKPFYIAELNYQKAWRLNTWDSMAWPLPFSKIQVIFHLQSPEGF